MSDMAESAGPAPITEEQLVPVFQLLGQRFEQLESRLKEVEDITKSFMGGITDAYGNHKRGELSEMMKTKFGGDLSELGDNYKEMYGNDLGEELIDKLMGGDLTEDALPDHIAGIKAKFNKIKGIAPASTPQAAPASPPPAAPMAGPPAPEAKEGEEPPEPEEEEPEPTDHVGQMTKLLGLKTSGPKIPKLTK